jgi:hypothetical protein
MQLERYKEKNPAAFQGSNAQKEMAQVAKLPGRIVRRLFTLWNNDRWKAMITRWCRTAVGRSVSNLSLWTDLIRFRVDDVSPHTGSHGTLRLASNGSPLGTCRP